MTAGHDSLPRCCHGWIAEQTHRRAVAMRRRATSLDDQPDPAVRPAPREPVDGLGEGQAEWPAVAQIETEPCHGHSTVQAACTG